MDAWRARLGKAVRFFFRMMTKTMRRTWGWRLTLLTWLCLNGVLLVVCVKGREQTLRGLGNYGQTHAPRLFCQGPNLGSQFLWGMLSHEEVIISHKFGKGLCTRQTFFLGGGGRNGCLWLGGAIFTPTNFGCVVDARIGYMHICHG